MLQSSIKIRRYNRQQMDLHNRNNFTEVDLAQTVLKTAKRNGLESYLLSQTLIVGVSGGPDSLALLRILCVLRGPDASRTLHVAHLDHALRGTASEEDAGFVAQVSDDWRLPCTVRRFDVEQYAREQRLSIEEAARNARYTFLANIARQQGGAVAVAHTADDQVETVLMHILRGSGISGLRGMRMLADVPVALEGGTLSKSVDGLPAQQAPVTLFRPLLSLWRSEIEAYCSQEGLEPRLDATNTDPRYKRNRIRHELLPLLARDYDPTVKAHLHNLAELAAGEDDLIKSLVEQAAERLAHVETEGTLRFEQSEVADLSEALRLRLVRWALRRVAGTLEGFTHRHIEQTASILSGHVDSRRSAQLPHGLIVERAADGWAAISRIQPVGGIQAVDTLSWPVMDPGEELTLIPGITLQLEAGWKLECSIVSAESEKRKPSDMLMLCDADEIEKLGIGLVLRTRRPGDFIRPLGMKGRKSLQDSFIDAKIPRRVRDHIPIVLCSARGGEALWVPGPGGRRSTHATVGPQTRRVLRLEFTRMGEA